ncbi:BTE_HP_G0106640.mRNA.1.CDS.1 [Saccharomyces cerevisiae]|nr:BTE_HP_G0106640.mRNA.1.CDS.1 [Saccharomyces cerevisiae]CAI6971200.1 BTE_HP_G0106640.mRNA.1.CDS.1 [Saccharomyces cerevisiae]
MGNPSGILGISLPLAEFTDNVENAFALNRKLFIEKKISYSLFLNGPNVHFGSILFGAVHKSKYAE